MLGGILEPRLGTMCTGRGGVGGVDPQFAELAFSHFPLRKGVHFRRRPINQCPCCPSWQPQPYFQGQALVPLLQEAFLDVCRSMCCSSGHWMSSSSSRLCS